MAYFEVDIVKLEQIPPQLEQISTNLQNLNRRLFGCMESLSDNFSGIIQIKPGFDENIGYLNKTMTRVGKFAESLRVIQGRYAYYEGQAANALQTASGNEESKESSESALKAMLADIMKEDEMTSTAKTFLKGASRWGDVKEAGVLESADSYMRDAYTFFSGDKKGMTGAGNWCSLADSSIGLWSDAYGYYADKYDVGTGFFGDKMQKNVAGLELGGSILGLGSSVFAASDGLSEKSVPGAIADYVDCGKDGVSVWSAGYKLNHISDAESLAKKKAGAWSGIDVYKAVAEAGIGSVSQGIRSYETYSADGVWDMGDTGAIGIDVSTAGIYALGHSLSGGLDDIVFRAIDNATGGSGNSDLSYAQKAAEGWKIIAKRIGDWIAK